MRIGKVLEVSKAEGFVVVHRHGAVTDSRLRVCWEPLFVVEGEVVAGAGAAADRELVPWAKLLAVVDLHSGVLAHSSARAFDRAGWRIDEGGPAADGGLQLSLSPGSVAAKLEQLQAALGQALEEAPLTKDSVKQWVAEVRVDFVEIFDGSRRLSLAVSREGERVGPGFDKIRVSYGQ